MAAFMMTLECGHEKPWQEAPGDGGGPVVGSVVYCSQCESDQEIAECDPRQYTIQTVTLSAEIPAQSPSPYGGYTKGDKVTVFYDTEDGTYGYCYHGVGEGGNYYEAEDVTGYASSREALEAAHQ